jgi:5-methylcytosine-specific restriction endonuclease McrA
MRVPAELDRRVRKRAKGVCEYCRLPQAAYPLSFQVDHIIAEQHHGKTQLNNLCQACPRLDHRAVLTFLNDLDVAQILCLTGFE